IRADGREFCVSSLAEACRDFCSVIEPSAAFSRNADSRVPRKEATANAAPHKSARAAVTAFNPFPAIPRKSPQSTDKFTNVIAAVTHFMELWRGPEKVLVFVRCQQSQALCPGTHP